MKIMPWKSKDTPTQSDLLTPLTELRREFDDLLERFWRGPWDGLGANGGLADWGPRMDVTETEDAYELHFELPGVRREDVDVQVLGSTLTVRGEKREHKDDRRGERSYSERSFGSFQRSMTLPADADAEKIEASFTDGVLTIRLTRNPATRARKIAVHK